MKGVEFPKYGFGEFILGSEERRKDKEPCGSMILMEERDRKSEEAKKDRRKERKTDRKRGKNTLVRKRTSLKQGVLFHKRFSQFYH